MFRLQGDPYQLEEVIHKQLLLLNMYESQCESEGDNREGVEGMRKGKEEGKLSEINTRVMSGG
jgi:hypothetical protein